MNTTVETGMAAVYDWRHLKDDIDSPVDALGAVLHREKHPSKKLDGVSCGCWERAQWMLHLLKETGFEVALIPVAMKAAPL